ncbi:cell division protein [Halorubellus sp. JP-L1]|uniref:tubulin/FtsZ family protein n=1 Tax=Halorubellus sp. JP-L1 TaxID=2715753 RepID=UPI00140CB5D1|nr:tubulin/FtsZ family protein [Halorubellus sp. JP-L1]NHN40608.1 cell division protein [Halorubellus sp. JP-L1]
MKLALIGFGNAGSKIVDELLYHEHDTDLDFVRAALAINSARTDLAKLDYVPPENQMLIGQTHERVKGQGVGADPDLGAEVTRQDLHEIERALDEIPLYDVDAFLVAAGLGGGTGSGGAPVLASGLRAKFDEPVYGLGVLPSDEEGGRAAFNAARSFQSFVEASDNVLVFDNDAWRGSQDTVGAGYERTNRELAKRLGTLFAAGNVGDEVAENAMDASDVRRTLATGGVSTIAYAETELSPGTVESKGLLSRFKRNGDAEDVDAAQKVSGLVRQAIQSRLTCPADVSSVERSLVVVAGPSGEFSRKGLERARQWVEQETGSMEVLAGDSPQPNADRLSAVVVLSNPTDVRRVDELQGRAVDAKGNMEAQEDEREDAIEDLITDDAGELDPI